MEKNNISKLTLYTIIVGWGVLLLGSSCILKIYFDSLIIQRLVKQETIKKQLKMKADYVIKKYPKLPNITCVAEPVAVQKARYLVNEKRYNEAIKVLKLDHSNPYDARKEFFIATSFYQQKMYDSAIVYAKQAQAIKPIFFNNTAVLTSSYEKNNYPDKALDLWVNYLKSDNSRQSAWRNAVVLCNRLGKIKQAKTYIDSAKVLFPKDSIINLLHKQVNKKIFIGKYGNLFNKATGAYKAKNYKLAKTLLKDFHTKVPKHLGAIELAIFTDYYVKDFKSCLSYIEKLEKLTNDIRPNIINLKGVAYFNLKQRDKACIYFKKAKDLGDKDGISNTKKFCK